MLVTVSNYTSTPRMLRKRPVARCKQSGFSLLELLLVVALSGPILYAALSTHSYIWAKAWQGQTQLREAQSFYALGHWLVREIRDSQIQGAHWQWQADSRCLRFADKGVRLRNKQLQWKPNEGDCNSNGWLGLHDAKGFKIADFNFNALAEGHFQLCMQGRYRQNKPLNWCYHWLLESE